MHAGRAVFFEGLSKQSDVTTLNWGKGACKFLRNEFDRMAVFLKNSVSLSKTPLCQNGQSMFFSSRPMVQKPPQNSGQKPPREKHGQNPMDVISIGNHGGFHKNLIFQRVNPVNPEI